MNFSLGLVEVSALGNAIAMLDEMVKVANVEFVAVERKLGGRLVTIVVKGSVSAVTASVETGRHFAERLGCLKSAEVIANPHSEILKFIHLDKEEIEPNTQSAATHTGSVGKKESTPKNTQKSKTAVKPAAKTVKSQAKKASDKKSVSQKRGTKKVK
jgi:microcompartment protein CcmL/EutN